MKKFAIHIALMLGLVLAGASCSDDPAGIPEVPGQPGEGAVSFAIAMPQTRAEYDDTQYPWTHCAIRIYKLTADETDGTVKELIRRYNSPSEMPAALWLLAGEYSIAVELGSKAEATFDEPTYRGEKEFRIVEGETQSVEVECRIVNTIVKVIYDQSIPATFKETFRTTVAFDQQYTQENIDNNRAAHLVYESTAAGYFILPEERATLCWQFYGEGEKNGEALKLEKTGSQEIATEPGVCYELKFKYSKDLGGTLDFTLTLDENPDEVDDPIVFQPNPQITGGNFDLNDLQRFTGEALVLTINSIADMERVRIETAEGLVCEAEAATSEENADGIAVTMTDPTDMAVALGANFFARFGGGDQVLTITAIDQDGGEGTKTMTVRTQGALSLTSTDPWNARGLLKVVAFAPEGDLKIGYRKAGDTEWRLVPVTLEENDIYSAEAEGIHAATEYEYRLFRGDEPVNAPARTATASGPQVYNAGFETWSGSSPLLPYTSDADQWWDTGNHGSSTIGKNVTTKENDARPGSKGSASACLNSQFVGAGIFGKFAAGNIFVGQYLGTDGTDGVIGFGKPFAFTYRPRQLKFWYKGTAGTVDYAGGKVSNGDTDVNQIYICLCKMGGPHVVATKRQATFLDFSANSKTMNYCTALNGKSSDNDRDDGHIIAWAEWNNTQSMADWTEITLDLHYNEEYEGEVPTYLMLTASASKYGDYFSGSTSSYMYLDDFELVY